MKISHAVALALATAPSFAAAKRHRAPRQLATTTTPLSLAVTTTKAHPSTTTRAKSSSPETTLSTAAFESTTTESASSAVSSIHVSTSIISSSSSTTSASGPVPSTTDKSTISTTTSDLAPSSMSSMSTLEASSTSTSSSQTSTMTDESSTTSPTTTTLTSASASTTTSNLTSGSGVSSSSSSTATATTSDDSSAPTEGSTTTVDAPSSTTSASSTTSFSFDTAAYTYYEVELPTTFVDVASITTPTTTQTLDYTIVGTPAPSCAVDPTDFSTPFKLLDGNHDQIIPISSTFKILQETDFPSASTEEEAAVVFPAFIANLPMFQLEQPANAPSGFYDIFTTYNSQKIYLGMKPADGSIVSSPTSSGGQTPNADSVVTTIFTFDCDGQMTVMDDGVEYVWTNSADNSTASFVAGTSSSATRMLLFIPRSAPAPTPSGKKRSLRSRNATMLVDRDYPATGVNYARCPNTPSGLISKPNGSRDMGSNGCGSGIWAKVIPQFGFNGCCNNHDFCYDNCQGGEVEKCTDPYCAPGEFDGCNNAFYDCMHNDVCGAISWWHPISRGKCEVEASFYHWVVTTQAGVDAFKDASNRCSCQCKSGSLCDGRCDMDFNGSDDSNCGGCGWRCATGYSYHCQSGTCRCTANVLSDSQNCGACGRVCPYRTHCENGACACDQDRCGNVCVDTLSNPHNCGACGNKCASGYCVDGQCFTPPTGTPTGPPKCYGTDAVKNGGFDGSSQTPWIFNNKGDTIVSIVADSQAVSSPNVGSITSRFNSQVGSLQQPLTMCPGTSYDMTFSASETSGTNTISLVRIVLGGIHQQQPVFNKTMTTFGPFRFTVPAAPSGGGSAVSPYTDPNTFGFDSTGTFAFSLLDISVECWDLEPSCGVLLDDVSIFPS